MTREEVIRLAKLAGIGTAFYEKDNEPIIEQIWGGPMRTNELARFAHLVAAEYKQDAERYRFLLDQNSDYAVCHWVDGDWFALGITKEVIDSEIDAAMEKVK